MTNNGTSVVHLSQPVLAGANATEFTLDLNGGTSPCSTTTALAVGASCTMSVTFAPASVGQKTADLQIVSDAQNGLIHVALSGKGVQATPGALNFKPSAAGMRTTTFQITDTDASHPQHLSTTLTVQGTGAVPVLEVSSREITFPDTPAGTTSGVQTITVKNNGIVSTGTGVAFIGPNSGMYAAGPVTCNGVSGNLNPGNSCTIGVLFRPVAVGLQDGTMQLSDGTTVTLHGIGSASTPLPLAFSSTSLAFPDKTVGFTTDPEGLTITNVGSIAVDVTVQLLDEQGQVDFSGDFSYDNNYIACTDVRSGGGCRIRVQFSRKGDGIRSETLLILSRPAGQNSSTTVFTQAVALSGRGLAPAGGPLTLSPVGGLFFNQIGVPQTATLENDGDTPVSIVKINYPDNNCGTVLAAHATCQIPVDGTAGDVTVSATSSSTPYTLPISVPPDQASSSPGYIGFGSVSIGGNSYAGLTQPVVNGSSSYFTIAPLPVLYASDFPGSSCSSPDWRFPCTTTLRFSPTAAGLRTAIITTTPSPGVFKAYGIGGSGGDGAAFTMTENDFPDKIVLGYVGTVTLTNVGTTPLLLYREILTTYVHFGLTSSGCSLNNSIRVATTTYGGYGKGAQGPTWQWDRAAPLEFRLISPRELEPAWAKI